VRWLGVELLTELDWYALGMDAACGRRCRSLRFRGSTSLRPRSSAGAPACCRVGSCQRVANLLAITHECTARNPTFCFSRRRRAPLDVRPRCGPRTVLGVPSVVRREMGPILAGVLPVPTPARGLSVTGRWLPPPDQRRCGGGGARAGRWPTTGQLCAGAAPHAAVRRDLLRVLLTPPSSAAQVTFVSAMIHRSRSRQRPGPSFRTISRSFASSPSRQAPRLKPPGRGQTALSGCGGSAMPQ
jgi:hypothetical protein